MTCPLTPLTLELAQILARIFMMTLVGIGALLSIYLGWRLYMGAVVSKVTGQLEAGGFKLKFAAASPGIVLAAFGAWLLSLVAHHRFELIDEMLPRPASFQIAPLPYTSLKAFIPGEFLQIADAQIDTSPKATGSNSTSCQCLFRRRQYSFFGGTAGDIPNATLKFGLKTALDELRTLPEGTATRMKDRDEALRTLAYLQWVVDGEIELESSTK